MSGLLFMNTDDFIVHQGYNGKWLALSNEIHDLVLVLFYSNECKYCDNLLNIFKQLPNYINGCKFALLNINKNPQIIEKSNQTIAPITYVPDMILYVGRLPYIRYDGPHQMNTIREFVLTTYQKIKRNSFVQQQSPPPSSMMNPSPPPAHPPSSSSPNTLPANTPPPSIPAYTIGTPICGQLKKDKVCYLNFHSAYIK